jgi:hypothetical protein
VFLFQKDLESSRIVGLMRMLLKSREIIRTLTANDRVAILSFDSRLRIWTDFTNDVERLDRILSHDLLLEQPPPIETSSAPSLVERLGPDEARRTYGIERAMALIGEALEPLPGAKSLVLIGYGFGRLGLSGVAMENDYGAARRPAARVRTDRRVLCTNAHFSRPRDASAGRRVSRILRAVRREAGHDTHDPRGEDGAHAAKDRKRVRTLQFF